MDSYLIFHSLAELFSILIAFSIFTIAWNSRDYIKHSFFLFIGTAYASVVTIDLIHAMAYKGMGFLPDTGSNLATELWIAGRYVNAISLLVAPLFLNRKVKFSSIWIPYLIITVALLAIIFKGWFPDCYIEGSGLTKFKIISEYLVCLIIGIAMWHLWKHRQYFEKSMLRLLLLSMSFTILTELVFTLYIDIEGFFNILGHIFKIIAFALLYRAIIVTGLRKPYESLFYSLNQSEQKFRSLFEYSPDAIFITIPDGSITSANPSACAMLGWTEQEFCKLNREDVFDANNPQFINAKDRRQRNGFINNVELTASCKDGHKIPVEIDSVIIPGETPRAIIFMRDITERKKAESAILESKEILGLFIKHAPASLAMFDRNMCYLNYSNRWLSDYGLENQDLTGKSHYEVFPDIPERWRQFHQRGLTGETIRIDEDFFERADGSTQWQKWEVHPWRDASGEIGGIVIFTEDITNIKQAEEKIKLTVNELNTANETLRQSRTAALNMMQDAIQAREETEKVNKELNESKAKLQAALASMTDAVSISDVDGNFIEFNEAFVTYHRFNNKSECAKNFREYTDKLEVYTKDGEIVPVEMWADSRALRGERKNNAEYILKRKDTGQTWFGSYSFSPIFNDNVEIIGSIVVCRDITEIKQAQQEIENIAKFPEENPFPVLRLDGEGTILYSNPPGEIFMKQWNTNISRKVPKHWQNIINTSLKDGRYHVEKIDCENKIFSVAIAPVQKGGYVNLYGRDITTQEQIKDELRKSRDELDIKVKQRTEQLSHAVKVLKDEVKQRIQAQTSLKESEEKYRSLVEFSPEAVCVISDEKITFANSMVLKLIKAKEEKDVIGRSIWDFIHPDHRDTVRLDARYLLQKKNKIKPKETKLICLDGSTVEVEATATYILHNGTYSILIIFHDITERKLAESRRNTINSLLELYISKSTQKDYLDTLVGIISEWSKFHSVGVRLINDEYYIPYEAHIGFNNEFLKLENSLCLSTHSCLCTRAIYKISQPQEKSLFSLKGSFSCNNIPEFINSLKDTEKNNYRGNCVNLGYKSIAIIPIYYRNDILGAIHLADPEPNKVPLETVEFLEVIAMLLGEAIHRFSLEESLRANTRRLLEAQRIARLGNWEWKIKTNKIWWSDEVYRIFGIEPHEFGSTFESFLSFVHPDDRKRVEETVALSLKNATEYNIDFRVVTPDNKEKIIQAKGEVTYDTKNLPIKMSGTVYDITEQKQREQKIQENQKQLRALTSQLQLAEEQERRRIAQDLHDSIGQILSFSARELKNLQKTMPERTAESVKEVANQLNIAVEQARTLSFDLSPSILYDLGFEVAIEDLVDKMFKERNVKYCFNSCSNPKPLSEEIKILLYRSVRELLINSIKYSNATYVNVSLSRVNDDICIQVEDNGIGFDVSIFDNISTNRKGFGIFSIRERLNHIGGKINISSSEGKGTNVSLIAPLDIE